jgi:hypothetical protein
MAFMNGAEKGRVCVSEPKFIQPIGELLSKTYACSTYLSGKMKLMEV